MNDNEKTGFSLIEILIAITVLSVGLMGVFAAFFPSRQYIRQVETDTYASIIAQNVKSSIEIAMRDFRGISSDGSEYFIYTGPGVSNSQAKATGVYEKIMKAGSRNTGILAQNYRESYVKLPRNVRQWTVAPRTAVSDLDGAIPWSDEGSYYEINTAYRIGNDLRKIVEEAEKNERDRDTPEVREAEGDPLMTYSYCFFIRRVKDDDTNAEMYLFNIVVYRGFPHEIIKRGDKARAAKRAGYRPVYETRFIMAP